jgi:hypothetical protein
MAKTMVANVTGARLREVERQLAMLRGEAAVSAFIEAHPHETRVLQQLVEWRRAGRSVPPLARIQRAMIWNDGSIEISAVPGAVPAGRPGRTRAPAGATGRTGGPRSNGARGHAGGAPAPAGRPGRPSRRPHGRTEEDGAARGVPRAGEGWVLLREGDVPPPGPALGDE